MGLYNAVMSSTVTDADHYELICKSKKTRRRGDSGLGSTSEIDPIKRMEQLVVLATTPPGLETSRCQNPNRYSRVSALPPKIWNEIAKFAKENSQFGRLGAVLGTRRLKDKNVCIRGRIMAMELLDALFRRSGAARREIVDRIAVFIHSIMQSSGSQGAPNEVQSIILERLQEWDASHGREFKPLHAAVRYLREGKGFTFPEMEAVRNRRNAEREARRDERRCRLLLAKHEQLKREIPDTVHDLKDILKQAQSCMDIVTGNIFADFVNEEQQIDGDDNFEWEEGSLKRKSDVLCDGREDLLETVIDAGLGSTNYRIEVEVPMKEEQNVSADLGVVWEQLEGFVSLLRTRHRPLLSDWLATLGQVAGSLPHYEDSIQNEQVVRELTDIHANVDILLNREAILKQQRSE